MEGNSIGCITEYVTKAKSNSKPVSFAYNKEIKDASGLFGVDLVNTDKKKTEIIDKK